MKAISLVVIMACLLAAGCRQKQEPSPSKTSGKVTRVTQDDLDDIMMNVDVMMRNGQIDGALELLDQNLQNPRFKERGHETFFRATLSILFTAQRIDEAKEKFLGIVGKHEKSVFATFNMIHDYYEYYKQTKESAAWTDQLLTLDLPDMLAWRAYGWKMEAALNQNGMDAALALIPACVERFKEDSYNVIGGMVAWLMQEKRYDDVKRTIDHTAVAAKDLPKVMTQLRCDTTDLLAAKGEWEATTKHFIEMIGQLDHDYLSQTLNRTVSRAHEAGKWEVVDTICRAVMDQAGDKPDVRRQAAEFWLDSAMRSGKPDVFNQRLSEMLDAGFTPDDYVAWYHQHFYSVLKQDHGATLSTLLKLGDRIVGGTTNTESIAKINCMALDGAFAQQDFDRAAEILKSRDLGRKGDWQSVALNKVQAHVAMRDGRIQEAVDRFREFMKHVKGWQNDEVDPMTGVEYTKEMTLGYNAKRIGDLLATMPGRQAEATQAYQESLGYYEKALKKSRPGSPQRTQIETEMAVVPGAPKVTVSAAPKAPQ